MELTITNFNGIETIDSRLVAKAVDKEHYDLIKDIRRYSSFLTDGKISVSDFFIESTYQDSTGRTLPCYLCTRKGCEMIANKMTGQKGTVFTAMYINAFHSMENQLAIATPVTNEKELDAELAKAQAELLKAQTEKIKLFMQIADAETLSSDWKNIILSKAAEMISGEKLLPLPESEKTYSATEIGEMFGISAQKVLKWYLNDT